MSKEIVLQNGKFFIFEAHESEDYKQAYFSSEKALLDHIEWFLNNRTSSFSVFMRRFEN